MEATELDSTEEDIFYDCSDGKNKNQGETKEPEPLSVPVTEGLLDLKMDDNIQINYEENKPDEIISDKGDAKEASDKPISNEKLCHDVSESEQRATGFIAKDEIKEPKEYDPVSGISNTDSKSEDKPPIEVSEEKEACDGSDSDDESSEEDITLTEEQIEERQIESKKLKDEGNELYKKGEFIEAERIYTAGLKICPKSLHQQRSVMYSNRSACLLKLEKNESAIEDCTKAIELHPTYLKAILRRAQLYEKLEKFEEALKDYEDVLKVDPSIHTAREACLRMPGEIEKRNEKLKAQMMSSLKDLGNMFLRPFGLSTNNFQMQQDPATGSYNMQFNNSPDGGNGKPSNAQSNS